LFENYVDTIPPDDYTSYLKDADTNHIFLLKNPEVPVTIIYDAHLFTEQSFTWDYDPTTNTSKNQFALPTITTFTAGDGTVPVTSSLLPGMKWSWEYDNKLATNLTNPRPVKVVEFCSSFNNRSTVYDLMKNDSIFEVSKNEYIGLACDCMKGTDENPIEGSDCTHSVAISDSNFVRFLTNLTFTNQRIEDFQKTGAFLLTDSQLKQLSQTCPALNLDNTIYNELMSNQEIIDT